MGKGGGGQTTNTYDPAYNAGMLELSKEQQDWADQLFNTYKYGAGDREETQAWKEWDAKRQEAINAGKDPNDRWVKSWMGDEPERYTGNWQANNPNQTSYRDWEQMQLDNNAANLPYQNAVDRSGAWLNYGNNMVNLSLLHDTKGLSQDTLRGNRARINADMGVLPYETRQRKSDIGLNLDRNRHTSNLMGREYSAIGSGYDLTSARNRTEMNMLPREAFLRRDDIQTSLVNNQQARKLAPHTTYNQIEQYKLNNAQMAADRGMIGKETYLRGDNINTAVQRNQQSRELMPHETYNAISNFGLQNAQNAAERRVLPTATDLRLETIGDQRKQIRERAPVMSEYYKQALRGEDENAAANRAAADVTNSMQGMERADRMSAARMGVNPNSGRFQTSSIDRAKAIGAARTYGRNDAKNSNFNRLQSGAGMGMR